MTDLQDRLLVEARALFDEALARGMTVGFAESCTAGLCSAALACFPGSSNVLAGSVVSYMCSVKERVLGVDAEILDNPALGPVSLPCAEGMALGARRLLDCDVAVSVTGLAGPGGAEPGKPVGTVCFGLATKDISRSMTLHFEGSRDEIRVLAACGALSLAREGIMETKLSG